MKDKIKEILEGIEVVIKHDGTLEFDAKELKTLLDYITNLQEENRQTKLLKKRYKLEKEVYKSRNEKVIKMFNNETLNKYYYGMSYEFEINDFKEDMLNILQGSDDNE